MYIQYIDAQADRSWQQSQLRHGQGGLLEAGAEDGEGGAGEGEGGVGGGADGGGDIRQEEGPAGGTPAPQANERAGRPREGGKGHQASMENAGGVQHVSCGAGVPPAGFNGQASEQQPRASESTRLFAGWPECSVRFARIPVGCERYDRNTRSPTTRHSCGQFD